ncbi:unnamed protein product [Acanthocheilonema viteae]|uniref:EF-hand domain-containing protein n=1 Tax=Acanthocheilonema viteae TaxID=6277 RepID=A0A498S8W8_ACAVI|nr:unnamed protein product [Acanthocheilonema viteae]
MTRYDLTGDGRVDSRELRTVAYMNHKLPPTISDNIFLKADRNSDKFIDRTEIIAAVRLIQRHVEQATLRWLEDHDTDGDGLLNEAEVFESIYMELGLSTKDVSGCFRESDVNKDKYLTSNELIEMLHCSRLLALKEAKELLKIYDTDGDHRLNIQEAQMLADLRYDIEPSYATIVFEGISHRADHTINELELIDFLTKLREKAAVAALNKLSSLDQNGDEAVSFNELLQEYEKQLKKPVLKKIFSKVDVNKNAHIDPIEFVSLQNLIADEIHLQTIQNDFEQQYFINKNATTSLPALIIFNTSKKMHNEQLSKQRKRRSDPEADDTKFIVNDESHPDIRKLTASNANNVHFSTFVTAVPKFMKSNDEYEKFLSGGAKLISEIFTNSKKPENRDVIETNDIKKIQENSVSDENISPFVLPMMQKDRELMSVVNEDQLQTRSKTDENGHVGNQNGTLANGPNVAYINKFEKFFDFLQKTIKKISKAVKENNEKQEGLKSPLRSISIIKHSNQVADNISNTEIGEMKKTTNVSEKLIPFSTTGEKLKISGNLSNATYKKIYNEENLIVHTPIDESEYKTVVSKKFNGLFDTAFLQLDEKENKKKVKVIRYEGIEHEFNERNFDDAVEKNVDENGCILEDQTDSSDMDDSSEESIRSVKLYKCNVQTWTSNETTEPLQKIPKEFEKAKLHSESSKESEKQKKRRQKLQDKSSNKTDSLEYEITLPLLQNKSSSVSDKVYSEHDNNEATEITPDNESNEESDELSDDKIPTKHINSSESSKHGSINEPDNSIHQSLNSRPTDNHDAKLTRFEKLSIKTKGKKLSSNKTMTLDEKKLLNNEFGLPLAVDKKSKGYKISEENPIFSVEENVTNKHGQKVQSQLQMTTDSQLPELQNPSSEQTQLQVTDPKSQTGSNSSEGNEFFDEVLSDTLNATFSVIHQTSMASKSTKFKNHKNDSQKTMKPLLKLEKNDTVSQISKISMTSALLSKMSSTSPSSPEISHSATTNPNPEFSIMMNYSNDETTATETSLSTDYKNEQIPEVRTIIEIESDKINQTFIASNAVTNSATHLEDKNDTYDVSDMERDRKSNVTVEHNTEVELIQKKRKNCSNHRQSSQKKCLNKNNTFVEATNSTTNIAQVFWLFKNNLMIIY